MDQFKDAFITWIGKNQEEIDHVKGILSSSLADSPEELISDLTDAEAWNARVGFLLAEANSWLDKGRKVYFPEKEGRTESERKVVLDDETAYLCVYRDYIEVLCDSIKQRLILGESVLGYYRQFNSQGAKIKEEKPWG